MDNQIAMAKRNNRELALSAKKKIQVRSWLNIPPKTVEEVKKQIKEDYMPGKILLKDIAARHKISTSHVKTIMNVVYKEIMEARNK